MTNKTVKELEPCPFCGGEAEFERLGTPRQSTIVNCTECGCSFESGDEFNHASSWNRREAATTLTQQAAEIEALREAGAALIADVRRRYPGEELRCEYMIALDTALTGGGPTDG